MLEWIKQNMPVESGNVNEKVQYDSHHDCQLYRGYSLDSY